jgi:hypothetical protein
VDIRWSVGAPMRGTEGVDMLRLPGGGLELGVVTTFVVGRLGYELEKESGEPTNKPRFVEDSKVVDTGSIAGIERHRTLMQTSSSTY